MFGNVKDKHEQAAGLPSDDAPNGEVYEYKRIQTSAGNLAEFLNEHGKNGWHPVHIDQIHLGGTGGSGPYYILLERRVA